MTALLSLAVNAAPAAAEAVPLAPGQPVAVATPPGFAAILAAAQPLTETVPPVASAAPRFTPAQLWGLIDGETPPNLRMTDAAVTDDPANTPDPASEATEAAPETLLATLVAPLIMPPPPLLPVEKMPETPRQSPEMTPESAAGAVTVPLRPGVRHIAPPPVSPLAPDEDGGSRAPITVGPPKSAPTKPETSPKLLVMAAAMPAPDTQMPASPATSRLIEAIATATLSPAAASAAIALATSGAAAAPVASAALPPPPVVAAGAGAAGASHVAAQMPPVPLAQPDPARDDDRIETPEPEAFAALRPALAPTIMLPAATLAAALPPQTPAEAGSASSAAAMQTPPARPETLANVPTDAFGAVGIGVEGDAHDLKVLLTVSAGTPALLAADAPRLAADLAANGIRLQSLDVGSFSGGAASGGQQQRQGSNAGVSAPPAAFAAPAPLSRPAAADRYA